MSIKHGDTSFPLSQTTNNVQLHGDCGYYWLSGVVISKHGMLINCTGNDKGGTKYSRLETAYNGRNYLRVFAEHLTVRQFAIYANRFAKDILDEVVK